jgi:hypothetical protein
MKSQNEFLLKCLAVLPSLDRFNPGSDPAEGGGSTSVVNPFGVVDVQLISSNPASLGAVTGYTEVHMDSAAEGGTVPITHQDDADRVLLMMGLPMGDASWRMSLNLDNENGSDTVHMQGIEAKYSILRANLVSATNLRFEVVGSYFTIEVATAEFETYININQANAVVKLSYTNLNTFDTYSVSFLAKANV